MPTNRPAEPDELDRDPFEELASEFSERIRRGEFPSIEDYATSHPDIADEIRELFPTIAAMEKSKSRAAPPIKPVLDDLPIEQLGDFRLLGEIGRGGMGIVYEAEQVSLGRHVAVKVLPQQALLDERHLRRFEREAQTAAKLHHTNIVPVFGVGQQDGFNYIVMQFIAGVGLDEVLLALRRQLFEGEADELLLNTSSSRVSHADFNAQALLKGEFGERAAAKLSSTFVRSHASGEHTAVAGIPTTDVATQTIEFTVDQEASGSEDKPEVNSEDEAKSLGTLGDEFYQGVARIGEQVADALAYAHEQGTLHRDIKPGNLLLDSTGTVWVADFGLAKFAEQDNVSRTGDIVGTLSYIPPESFSGETDSRGDIYSLGLSLFELLTLRPAFFGRDRSQLVRQITEGNLPRLKKLNPNIPRDLETIVLKAVAHRPEDRYATAGELASDLNCYLNDMPIKARRMSIPEQFTRWYRKNKLVAALSAAVFSLLVLLTITFGVSNHLRRIEQATAEEQRDKAIAAEATAEEQRDKATKLAKIAEEERSRARDLADQSLNAIKSIIYGFAHLRLPVSADESIGQANSFNAAQLTEDQAPDEAGDAQSAVLVAPPSIKPEMAARLEVILDSLGTLAKGAAGNDTEFAATFADLTLRVGTLHKALGDVDKAVETFDNAIGRYRKLKSESDSMSNIIGLAVCLNEKGDLLGQTGDGDGSQELFRQSRELLEDQQDRLIDSPRAQYELARTLFLMSIQRQGPDMPTGQGPRRPPRSRVRGFFGGGTSGNLKKAINLLNPLVTSESNSEYRYLLARCYSALSSVAPREDREEFIARANEELGQLVVDQPHVDDYKYEFAMAKLRLVNTMINADERLKTMKQALELLDDICGTNPDVFNYQIARSRAQGSYVSELYRNSVRLAAADNVFAMMDRENATELAIRASQSFDQLRTRFDKEYVNRLPGDYEILLAEVIEKSDLDAAILLFRSAISTDLAVSPRARAELGLGRALMTRARNDTYNPQDSNLDFTEATQILTELNKALRKKCKTELARNDPRGAKRFFEYFSLLCEAHAVQFGMDSTEQLIEKSREQFLSAVDEDASDFAVWRLADFQIELAKVYTRLEQFEKANALRTQGRTGLERVIDDPSSKATQRFFAYFLLRDLYRDLGDEDAAKALEDKRPAKPVGRGRRRRRPPAPGDN